MEGQVSHLLLEYARIDSHDGQVMKWYISTGLFVSLVSRPLYDAIKLIVRVSSVQYQARSTMEAWAVGRDGVVFVVAGGVSLSSGVCGMGLGGWRVLMGG